MGSQFCFDLSRGFPIWECGWLGFAADRCWLSRTNGEKVGSWSSGPIKNIDFGAILRLDGFRIQVGLESGKNLVCGSCRVPPFARVCDVVRMGARSAFNPGPTMESLGFGLQHNTVHHGVLTLATSERTRNFPSSSFRVNTRSRVMVGVVFVPNPISERARHDSPPINLPQI
jgi:hypothetical protein